MRPRQSLSETAMYSKFAIFLQIIETNAILSSKKNWGKSFQLSRND